jgi:RNA polymerase sigma-70 factor (ECF subfamily)
LEAPMPDVDQQIVEASQKGDRAAFEQLVRRHGSSVLGYLTRVCGDRDQAEDCFQEAFAKAFQNLHQVRPNGFRAWLFRIATNTALDGFRRRNRVHMTSLDQTDESSSPGQGPGVVADPQPGPVEVASGKERTAAVRRAVVSLPDRQRATLVLVYFQGLSYGEAAEALGCTVGTVKTQMSRALETLAERLPDV